MYIFAVGRLPTPTGGSPSLGSFEDVHHARLASAKIRLLVMQTSCSQVSSGLRCAAPPALEVLRLRPIDVAGLLRWIVRSGGICDEHGSGECRDGIIADSLPTI